MERVPVPNACEKLRQMMNYFKKERVRIALHRYTQRTVREENLVELEKYRI